MIIGSGPIVIGQAAEFDFSGSQACCALREEGYQTLLVNSNPATIQTDLEMADIVYLEPLTAEVITEIIKKERPDGILSGMGGQTALNLCSELAEKGVLEKFKVSLLGTPLRAIADSENRDYFRLMMNKINEPIPKSFACNSLVEVKKAIGAIGGYPVIIRAAYTLGGTGSGIVFRPESLEEIVNAGLTYSRIKQVLVEECVLGWGEFEYEVMRDHNNNCITICNMENLDPMGIHTGESIVIAPAQTLSDRDHQMLRNAALKIIRALGIEGGCNVQFALNYETGEYRVIEVNPRVSRSSALASKATGYPIARVAAKIAICLTLDEIPNSVTGRTFASFEPALDYVVLKIPRWPFDKFRTIDKSIGTQMKSTGEVMAIGRTIEESLLKAIRSLEIDRIGLEPVVSWSESALVGELVSPTDNRVYAIAEALRRGYKLETIVDLTKWNKFFIHKIQNIIRMEQVIKKPAAIRGTDNETKNILARAKQMGFSDEYLSYLTGETEEYLRNLRQKLGITPTYKMVDTCAAEFEASTPYFYSTYEATAESRPKRDEATARSDNGVPSQTGESRPKRDEATARSDNGVPSQTGESRPKRDEATERNDNPPMLHRGINSVPPPAKGEARLNGRQAGESSPKRDQTETEINQDISHSPCPTPHLSKVLIIGSGPIRIGQGIEFDYCCVHGVMALREAGIKAIIINNNPETVSTDYDISDRLYFEPLILEDVLNVIERERPDGVILQFGGQTSVNLAVPLQEALSRRPDLPTKILGTSSESIDLAEDRRKFEALLKSKNITQPQAATGYSFEEVREIATQIGYPVLVRPSYVLGGKGMEIVYNEKDLEFYMAHAVKVSKKHPVLVDKYLSNAIEIDVDVICDGQDIFIGGIMEHIEQAGVHSGDAACVLPPQTLSKEILDEVKQITREIGLSLNVIGLMNLQLAVQNNKVYVLEANPRASRTIPFVSKAIGLPLAKIATSVMIGQKLRELNLVGEATVNHTAVKMPVFPFQKLPGLDPILGPEMKSTGEVMGLAEKFDEAYYKACLGAGQSLPTGGGTVYITICDQDKESIVEIARNLRESNLDIVATKGTAAFLNKKGIQVTTIWRISERQQPNALTLMREGKIQLIINTPTEGSGPKRDGYRMRRLAVELGIPFITTMAAARAAAKAIKRIRAVPSSPLGILEVQGDDTGSASGSTALTVKSLNEYLSKNAPAEQKILSSPCLPSADICNNALL